MDLQNLKQFFTDQGCQKLYVKSLSPNDNSKNQVYLGSGSWEILNIFPISEIRHETAGDWAKERFKAFINFYWLSNDGVLNLAPNAQFILYPKYPEIRFSGFLAGCQSAPNELMTQRLADRLLFLSISKSGNVIGFVAHPDSEIANQFRNVQIDETLGIFKVLTLTSFDRKQQLLRELYRINQLDWIRSKSLTKDGLVACEAPQCGGYTLEAELGIIRNGFAEPDYHGWEIKSFSVSNFNNLNSSTITLFTPEPTDGLYKSEGVEFFIRNYGYPDKSGKPDRLNFGGIHKVGLRHPTTNLELKILGYDETSGKIKNSDGCIALVDKEEKVAASWNFSSLLTHWNKKHNQACYVPSMSLKNDELKYKYGDRIILGTGTNFQLFLNLVSSGLIYYDPGIKLEGASTATPKSKKRSQFRVSSKYLNQLYKNSEVTPVKESN